VNVLGGRITEGFSQWPYVLSSTRAVSEASLGNSGWWCNIERQFRGTVYSIRVVFEVRFDDREGSPSHGLGSSLL
jgi:hypothetical protein